MSKSRTGHFFEDFRLGQRIAHATPRTLTAADQSLYIALTGSRACLHSADTVARAAGFERRPLEDLLVFNTAFGKTVPDVSLNAVANLGYADLRFAEPVYDGDTLSVASEVIGLKENSSRKTGVVYVRSIARNQHQREVLSWIRWVMVHKRDPHAPVAGRGGARAAGPGRAWRAVDRALRARHRQRRRRHRRERPVGGLRRRRAHRSRQRDDGQRQRPQHGHPPVPEHRQGPLRCLRHGVQPHGPAAGLWRARDVDLQGAGLRRAGEHAGPAGHQRRQPCRAGLRRRHRLLRNHGAGKDRSSGTPRSARCGCG